MSDSVLSMGRDAGAWFALTADELAALAAVHVTTARRWLRRREAPDLVERTLTYLRAGELAPLSSTWSGWCVRGEHLVAPSGETFSPGAVLAGPLELATLHAQRRELDVLRTALARETDPDHEAALEELEQALEAAREALSYLPRSRARNPAGRGDVPRSCASRSGLARSSHSAPRIMSLYSPWSKEADAEA